MSKDATTKPRLEVTSRRVNEGVTAHVIGWTGKPKIPVTAVDGYRAAACFVEGQLDLAEKQRPKRLKKGYRKSAGYREGYWEGLLFAHCLHAMGEHPQNNEQTIRAYLSQYPAPPDPAPVVSSPKRCPWCIPGVDNCHHSQEEIDNA